MDLDPELDVTLSDGREAVTFRIAAVQGALEAWAIVEPFAPLTVVVGRDMALARRSRADRLIADRLAAGWVPLDPGRAAAPRVAPPPLPPDLVLQLGSLVEALAEGRAALRAVHAAGAAHRHRRARGTGRARAAGTPPGGWRSRPVIGRRRSSITGRRWRRTRGSASSAAWRDWRRPGRPRRPRPMRLSSHRPR